MGPQGGLVCYDETLTLLSRRSGRDFAGPLEALFSSRLVESSPFPPSLLHPVPSPPSLDLSAHPLLPLLPFLRRSPFALRLFSFVASAPLLHSASTGESCLNAQTKRWIKGTAAAAHAQRKNGRTTRRARERQRERDRERANRKERETA